MKEKAQDYALRINERKDEKPLIQKLQIHFFNELENSLT